MIVCANIQNYSKQSTKAKHKFFQNEKFINRKNNRLNVKFVKIFNSIWFWKINWTELNWSRTLTFIKAVQIKWQMNWMTKTRIWLSELLDIFMLIRIQYYLSLVCPNFLLALYLYRDREHYCWEWSLLFFFFIELCIENILILI